MEPRPSLALLLLVTCVSGLTVSADTGADLVEDAEEAGAQEQGVREKLRVPQFVMLCRRWAQLQCFAGRTGRTAQ